MEKNGLDILRENIDQIDDEILKLFIERMKLCKKVADYKKENNLPVMQGNREADIIKRVVANSPDELKQGSEELFINIMKISKELQHRKMEND